MNGPILDVLLNTQSDSVLFAFMRDILYIVGMDSTENIWFFVVHDICGRNMSFKGKLDIFDFLGQEITIILN